MQPEQVVRILTVVLTLLIAVLVMLTWAKLWAVLVLAERWLKGQQPKEPAKAKPDPAKNPEWLLKR